MKYYKLFFLITLAFVFAAHANEKCTVPSQKFDQELMNISKTRALEATERALGPLSAKQKNGLDKVLESKKETYTLEEIAAQKKDLKQANFSTKQIAKLQDEDIIPRTVLSIKPGTPTSVAVKEIEAAAFDARTIASLKKGDEVHYVLDGKGQMLSLNKSESFSPESLWYMKNKGSDQANMVKEAGTISFDQAKKQYVFKPSYSADLAQSERQEMMDQAQKLLNTKQVKLLDDVRMTGSKTIDCLDVLSSQSKGKNFIVDRMISDNAVLTTAILTSEIAGAKRLATQDGRDVVAADYVGTNLSVLINGTLGKHLVLNNAGMLTSLGTRTLTAMGMIEMQRNVYNTMLKTNAEERASDIASFDRAHFVGRLFINHYFDQFLVKKLPELVFNACQRDSKARVFISPRAVRIYERYSSAMIYYGLRSAVVGE